MTDYIRAEVCRQGHQRNQNCEIDQQRQVTAQRSLPGELPDSC
jgi:hypothetical protein